ncbi:MAG: hypothetical protein EP299_05435 [Acidobacteria bacterium]|nr:MAG: hypothetical protein EP299_05435 [Acidobacteriota bacterium]
MREKPIRRVLRVVFVLLLGMGVFAMSATPAKAAGWDIDLMIYLWALGMDGSTTVRGQEADVDISFSEIFDNLDLAFSTHLEGRKRESNWGWFFDIYWADLSKDFERVQGNLDMQMTYLEAAGAYNTGRDFQLFAGFRYISMDTTLKFDPQIPVPPELPTRFDSSQSWTDLMVGGRLQKALGKRWHFYGRGDLAGFGISDGSDFTWNVVLMARAMVSARWSILFGYRWLDIDYENKDDAFALDVRQAGPVLAIGYAFH